MVDKGKVRGSGETEAVAAVRHKMSDRRIWPFFVAVLQGVYVITPKIRKTIEHGTGSVFDQT